MERYQPDEDLLHFNRRIVVRWEALVDAPVIATFLRFECITRLATTCKCSHLTVAEPLRLIAHRRRSICGVKKDLERQRQVVRKMLEQRRWYELCRKAGRFPAPWW